MAYALVAQVSLEGRSREEGDKMLQEQLIPAVKQQPGFERGVWLRSLDGSTGMGVVVCDTEENLEALRAALPDIRGADAPPMTSSEVFEVTAQA